MRIQGQLKSFKLAQSSGVGFTYTTDNFNEYLEYRVRLYEYGIRDLHDVEEWIIYPGSESLASSDISASERVNGTGVQTGDDEAQELHGTTETIYTDSQVPDMDDTVND